MCMCITFLQNYWVGTGHPFSLCYTGHSGAGSGMSWFHHYKFIMVVLLRMATISASSGLLDAVWLLSHPCAARACVCAWLRLHLWPVPLVYSARPPPTYALCLHLLPMPVPAPQPMPVPAPHAYVCACTAPPPHMLTTSSAPAPPAEPAEPQPPRCGQQCGAQPVAMQHPQRGERAAGKTHR